MTDRLALARSARTAGNVGGLVSAAAIVVQTLAPTVAIGLAQAHHDGTGWWVGLTAIGYGGALLLFRGSARWRWLRPASNTAAVTWLFAAALAQALVVVCPWQASFAIAQLAVAALAPLNTMVGDVGTKAFATPAIRGGPTVHGRVTGRRQVVSLLLQTGLVTTATVAAMLWILPRSGGAAASLAPLWAWIESLEAVLLATCGLVLLRWGLPAWAWQQAQSTGLGQLRGVKRFVGAAHLFVVPALAFAVVEAVLPNWLNGFTLGAIPGAGRVVPVAWLTFTVAAWWPMLAGLSKLLGCLGVRSAGRAVDRGRTRTASALCSALVVIGAGGIGGAELLRPHAPALALAMAVTGFLVVMAGSVASQTIARGLVLGHAPLGAGLVLGMLGTAGGLIGRLLVWLPSSPVGSATPGLSVWVPCGALALYALWATVREIRDPSERQSPPAT